MKHCAPARVPTSQARAGPIAAAKALWSAAAVSVSETSLPAPVANATAKPNAASRLHGTLGVEVVARVGAGGGQTTSTFASGGASVQQLSGSPLYTGTAPHC